MNTKKLSMKQESKIAKEVNGRTQIASGALPIAKADVRNSTTLFEAKTTHQSYYVLKLQTWDKIRVEATQDSLREPMMQIDLHNGRERLAVVNYDSYTDYIEWLPKGHEVHEFSTAKGSYRITYFSDNISYVVKFIRANKKPLRLLVTPWTYLLMYMKDAWK